MSLSEVLVIGGGLAGALAAMRLAEAGRDVLLLEKERGPHDKVCGEFLSAEAVGYLRAAGVDPLTLGAERIDRLRVSFGTSVAETALPFRGLSLSRRVLDETLLERARGAGVHLRRGVAVEALVRDEGTWTAELAGGERVAARTAILATGKHELRGWNRTESAASVQGDLLGFKMHWRLRPEQTSVLRGWMDLFLFPGGYGGLALVEDGVANLCLVVRRRNLRKSGGWATLLDSIRAADRLLGTRLSEAEPLWQRPLAISSIPYGYLAEPEQGLWRVGDQAAVIPSFTGDGMSIALHSGALAADMYLGGARAERYQLTLAASLRRGMQTASLLSRVAVTPAAQFVAPMGLRFFPEFMRWIAASTRIPDSALLSR